MSFRGVGTGRMDSVALALALAVTVSATLAGSGCETRTVDPTTNVAVKQPFTTVVIGDVAPLYPEWKRLVRFYKEGLAQKLSESGAFERVLYPAPVALPPDAIVVEGVIDGIDEGSELMRLLIADNASRAVVRGQFRLVDGSRGVMAEFRQERVSDGSNVHDEQIYMEDLVGQFGRDTAGVVVRWSRGDDLEPDWRVVEWWDETMELLD